MVHKGAYQYNNSDQWVMHKDCQKTAEMMYSLEEMNATLPVTIDVMGR